MLSSTSYIFMVREAELGTRIVLLLVERISSVVVSMHFMVSGVQFITAFSKYLLLGILVAHQSSSSTYMRQTAPYSCDYVFFMVIRQPGSSCHFVTTILLLSRERSLINIPETNTAVQDHYWHQNDYYYSLSCRVSPCPSVE